MLDVAVMPGPAIEPTLTDWSSLIPRLDDDALDACFFDSLSDGADDVVTAILAEYERRGREPGA